MTIIQLRTHDLAWHKVDESIICLDIARSQYLSINPAGTTLWPLLLEGATMPALVRQLVEEFEISDERAGHEVEAFVRGLRERQLLRS